MKDKQLWYFHRQVVAGLDCSSFLFNGWGNGFSTYEEDAPPALVLAEGTWQKEKLDKRVRDLLELMPFSQLDWYVRIG